MGDSKYAVPALTGSDKQIAWAMVLRAEVIGTTERELDRGRRQGGNPAEIEMAERAFYAAVARHTDAAWWIDHRPACRQALNADYLAEVAAIQAAQKEQA